MSQRPSFDRLRTLSLLAEEPKPEQAPTSAPAFSLLDAVLEATRPDAERTGGRLDQFLAEPSPGAALRLWVGDTGRLRTDALRRHVVGKLAGDIARVDQLLNAQVNAVLHHPAYQKLEASWRGLHYLVHQVPEGENVKVRVLSATWKEVTRDMERAIEFDQSQLFHKVYSDEFGTPGGEPFSVLIGDYEVRHKPAPEHPFDDMATLRGLSGVAAAAFAPLVTAAHPSFLDLPSYTDLELPLDLPRTFAQAEYLKWRAFRDTEDARFVGLALPRVLMRLPYDDDPGRVDGFRFREDVADPTRGKYLWGNAAYAFAAVLVRTFAQSGWLAAIRGVERGEEAGGVVTGLPAHDFATDPTGAAPKCSTDAIVTDAQEKELGELGFIPLCHLQDTDRSAFYGNQSAQLPKKYDELPATVNARLSSMLQYMLCVSRFAHYLKVISRDKLGAFAGPAECEEFLRKWVANYVTSNEKAGPELKARYPLREARVQVREQPGKPGSYLCVMHLRPHYQLDQLVSGVRLVTELAPSQPT